MATDTAWWPGAMQIELKEIRKYFGNAKNRLVEDYYQQTGLTGQLKPEGLDSQATTGFWSLIWQEVQQS